jgi:hypothetical protein
MTSEEAALLANGPVADAALAVNANEAGQARDAFALIAPDGVPTIGTVFEGADQAARFSLVPYQLSRGPSDYDVFVGRAPGGAGWALTVRLVEGSVATPGARPATANAMRGLLRFVTNGQVQEKSFDEASAEPGGLRLVMNLPTLEERDRVHAALTTSSAKPTLILRRVLDFGVRVPDPRRDSDEHPLHLVAAGTTLWHTTLGSDGTWAPFADAIGRPSPPLSMAVLRSVGRDVHACYGVGQAAMSIYHATRQPVRWKVENVTGSGVGIRGPVARLALAEVNGELHLVEAITSYQRTAGVPYQAGAVWHSIYRGTSWAAPVEVTAQTGSPGGTRDLACTGSAGVLHFCLVTTDGGLSHALRNPDGHWTRFQDVKAHAPDIGHASAVGCAAIGGELHVVIATASNNALWYTRRDADGAWTQFTDLAPLCGACGDVSSVSLAARGGELNLAVLSRGATTALLHSTRHADGSWTQFRDMQAQTGAPGAFNAVAIESMNVPPIVRPPTWAPRAQAFDLALDFYFDASIHAAIFSGVSDAPAAAASLTPFTSGEHVYFRDGVQPNVFYYVPDAFKIQRRPTSPRLPLVSARLAGSTIETAQVVFSYTAVPVTDPARLAAARSALRSHSPGDVSLQPLELAAPKLSLAYPGSESATGQFQPRDHAQVSLRKGISDQLTLSLDGFRTLFESFAVDGAQFRGAVRVEVAGVAVDVPFDATAGDLVGDVFERVKTPNVSDATMTVVVTSAIESPVRVGVMTPVLLAPTGERLATRTLSAPALPAVLSPASNDRAANSLTWVLAPAAGELDPRMDVTFDDAHAVTVMVDRDSLLAAILDPSVPPQLFRTITTKLYSGVFGPRDAPPERRVVDVQVIFDPESTADFVAPPPGTPDGMLTASVQLRVASVSDFVLGRAVRSSYRYRLHVLYADGHITDGDWREDSTGTLLVTLSAQPG